VHLSEGRVSVFDDLVQLQHLASSIAYNQTIAPTTIWNRELDVVQVRGSQVRIKALVSGVQSMLSSLNKKMHGLSGGNPVKYSIPEKHVDDLSSMERGKSWMHSSYTEPREHALMQAMVREGQWNLTWVNEDGSLTWNKAACTEFMEKTSKIIDLIIALVHMGSGPPLRGEDVVRDQIRNGIQPRTLYLCFGQMVAIRRHSKDTNSKGIDPFNVCYFPKSLTDAICYYLLVIRPLETLVAKHLYEDEAKVEQYNLFMYVRRGERMTSNQLSSTLEKLTRKHVGVPLSLQILRHILIAFQRAYVEELRVERGNNIGDLISSHSSKTADKHYAVEYAQPEGQTTNYLMDVQDWCDSYHDAIGLGEQNLPLIPLRVRRQLARRLGSVISTAKSGEPSATVAALLPLIQELTALSHKSVMEDLKPFLSKELRAANADAMEYQLRAQMDHLEASNLPLQNQQGTPEAQEPPQIRPIKALPTRSSPKPSLPTPMAPEEPPQMRLRKALPTRSSPEPSLPTPMVPEDPRRVKRHLSSGEQSRSKRRPGENASDHTDPYSSAFIHHNLGIPPTHSEEATDVSMVVPSHSRDTNLEAEETENADHQPPTQLSSSAILPVDLPVPDAGEVEPTIIACLSSMHLEPEQATEHVDLRLEHNQAAQQTTLQASDHPVEKPDLVLEKLRILRREPQASFKTPAQRKLVTSVLSGKHTIAVLPTGGGKSLAYELPPLCSGLLTIAAFPFKVITAQAKQNCENRGVAFEHWTATSGRLLNDNNTRLILMALETLLSNPILE